MPNIFADNLDCARALAPIADLVPLDLVEAAAEALNAAAEDALEEIRQAPGRRGNPAKRRAAYDDYALAGQLHQAWATRARVTPGARLVGVRHLEHVPPPVTNEAPALGPRQLQFVMKVAPTWQQSRFDLYEAARVTIGEETPLDCDTTLREKRRKRAEFGVRWAAWKVEERDREVQVDLKRLEMAMARANDSIRAAMQWREELQLQTQVAALTDDQLNAYEADVNAGREPQRVLDRLT